MAVQNITYINKVDLNETEVADINKVKASDMNEIKSVVNNNGTILSGINGTVLWTNPNPTSDFGPQNITLSSSDYDMIEVFYRSDAATNLCFSERVIKGYSFQLNLFSAVTQAYRWARRCIYVDDVTYTIPNCYLVGDSTTHNDQLVPLYVIGYKTGLFGGV